MEPYCRHAIDDGARRGRAIWNWLTALAVLSGLALLADASMQSSATYDEVAYLRVAARWWRTGDQTEITRMGSPLTFWKLQQVPVLWLLDHLGRSEWVDDPIGHQRRLLPLVRLGSLWIWLMALTLTTAWSRASYGPKAMVLAAWLFALSPNLIAHGSLATMELPLVAATTATFWFFWRFMASKRWPWFWAAAAVCGVAFSCKYTAILFPPILAVVWWIERWQGGERHAIPLTGRVGSRMVGFMTFMLLSNLVVTGFARIPLSNTQGHHPSAERWLGEMATEEVRRLYEIPLPQDWVGFATQMHHQATGGCSYLWGQRRTSGWWYYYLVALAVKVPLGFWLLVLARSALISRSSSRSSIDLLPIVCVLFLTITALGSSRNYGMRYLLPLAPLAIVWISGLAHHCTTAWARTAIALGLLGQASAIAGIHPHELTYFNEVAGGPIGGRHILSDSNLDWGQGLKSLVRLQRKRPEYRDLTFYYFGDTDPAHYGVAGRSYVINAVDDRSSSLSLVGVSTRYIAVSASLLWGPWGPKDLFSVLDTLQPECLTDDTTIAIYRTDHVDAHLDSLRNTGSFQPVVGAGISALPAIDAAGQ
jgi:4-amino-4-deoxy-L-arabinose transferase-like glycosyltransferase